MIFFTSLVNNSKSKLKRNTLIVEDKLVSPLPNKPGNDSKEKPPFETLAIHCLIAHVLHDPVLDAQGKEIFATQGNKEFLPNHMGAWAVPKSIKDRLVLQATLSTDRRDQYLTLETYHIGRKSIMVHKP